MPEAIDVYKIGSFGMSQTDALKKIWQILLSARDGSFPLSISGATPSGPAGGDLTGTYPNPTLAVPRATLGANNFTGLQTITGTTGTLLSIVGSNGTTNLQNASLGFQIDNNFIAPRIFISNSGFTVAVLLDCLTKGVLKLSNFDGTNNALDIFGDGTKKTRLEHDGTNAKLTWTSGQLVLSTLPTSDPGVSGALYKTAGAVFQSA